MHDIEGMSIEALAELRDAVTARLADRVAAEQAARDADKKHRASVMKSAKEAIMTYGADEEASKKIVLAIVAGEIPNVALKF